MEREGFGWTQDVENDSGQDDCSDLVYSRSRVVFVVARGLCRWSMSRGRDLVMHIVGVYSGPVGP